jgi:deaminated glutathione amidase
MASFKAAAVQMRSGTEPGTNIETLRRLVGEAAAAGASYVQTPEMTGMIQKDRARLFEQLKPEAEDGVVAAAAELAKRHAVHLHIGSTAIALGDGKVANRAFVFTPDGAIAARYDKIHMFDVDLDNGESWRESGVYRPGEASCLVDLPFARIGLAVCYDIRFPHLFRDLALAGA